MEFRLPVSTMPLAARDARSVTRYRWCADTVRVRWPVKSKCSAVCEVIEKGNWGKGGGW